MTGPDDSTINSVLVVIIIITVIIIIILVEMFTDPVSGEGNVIGHVRLFRLFVFTVA